MNREKEFKRELSELCKKYNYYIYISGYMCDVDIDVTNKDDKLDYFTLESWIDGDTYK